MEKVYVYRRIGDDEPIGEITVFKHYKDAKRKLIADVEEYFATDFSTLKETVNEYHDLYIAKNCITFEVERWEVIESPVFEDSIC